MKNINLEFVLRLIAVEEMVTQENNLDYLDELNTMYKYLDKETGSSLDYDQVIKYYQLLYVPYYQNSIKENKDRLGL